MRDLNYQLKRLCRDNRDGSYGTQVQRERMLTLIANQLHDVGYRRMNAKSLRPKHIEALTQYWLQSKSAAGTMKNRMCAIRWWARKVNKQNVVARSNDHVLDCSHRIQAPPLAHKVATVLSGLVSQHRSFRSSVHLHQPAGSPLHFH